MKAMIFAAGLGTRLKPLTDTRPKALVEIEGKPLLEYVAGKIIGSGIVDGLVVNVHSFSEMLREWIESRDWALPVQISDEADMLLDTGGAVLRALPLLRGCGSLLLHNVDILSNADLREFALLAAQHGNTASLMVSARKSSRSFLFEPDHFTLVGWRNNNTGEEIIVKEGIERDKLVSRAFTGIHIISEEMFPMFCEYRNIIDNEVFGIRDFYLWAAYRCPIYGIDMEGVEILDVGKPEAVNSASAFVRKYSI